MVSLLDEQGLRQRAVGLLSRRDHSRQELAQKLRSKAESADDVEAVLRWCEEHDFLNDQRFARFFVQSRIDRGHGPLRIRQELRLKGISAPLVEQMFDECQERDVDWFALAASALQRRFKHAADDDLKAKARQLRFLQSRGFDAEHCYAALDVLRNVDNDA